MTAKTFEEWFFSQNFTWNRIFVGDDLETAFTAGRAAGINQAASHVEGQLKMARDFDPPVAMILGAIVREIRALNKEGE